MSEQLKQNLPLALVRKPIRYSQGPKDKNALQNQCSTTSEEAVEDDDEQIICGVQPKRIRYLNPMHYFVIADVSRLPRM